MRIAFIDLLPYYEYTVGSAYERPLGGSMSAMCYLAEAIAQQGHSVFLFNHTISPGLSRGVMCLPIDSLQSRLLQSLDALIIQNIAGEGARIRQSLSDRTRLILWTQHAHDQPAIAALSDPVEQQAYDGFAFVSEWQRQQYEQVFGMESQRSIILRNAIAPIFQTLWPDPSRISVLKSHPPILAYTSTPYRGLDLLLDVFPAIRASVPGTKLKVFSSMKVYQMKAAEDEARYGWLYQRCQETEGVEYIGPIPQPDLARELASVRLLAYPNTFEETSCIAVMEAMASGCQVITTAWGALPETTAGFAHLIPVQANWDAYKTEFLKVVLNVLQEPLSPKTEQQIQEQVQYVHAHYTWQQRAIEWVTWLEELGDRPAVLPSLITAAPVAVDKDVLETADPGNTALASLTPFDDTLDGSPEVCDLPLDTFRQTAWVSLSQGHYLDAIALYEQLIHSQAPQRSDYGYLGLAQLLQGQTLAQETWMTCAMNAAFEEGSDWTSELVEILTLEQTNREVAGDRLTSQLLQQYIDDIQQGNT